jgi:hypothetical protein
MIVSANENGYLATATKKLNSQENILAIQAAFT